MSAALNQVLDNIKKCIERTYVILHEKGVDYGF
jgi:hypothetical protein